MDNYHRQVREDYNAVRGRLTGLEHRVGELETQLREAQSQVVALTRERDALALSLQSETTRAAEAMAQLAVVEGKLAEAKREARRLEAALREAGGAAVAMEPGGDA
jgi:chromosome segregation ATPase